jgi:hypothetical protein
MRGPLPFMKSIAEAKELCQEKQDPFYLTAVMIEAWLGDVVLRAAAEYAEKKNAKERTMQRRQAALGFQEVFGHADDEDFPHVWECLLRFAEYDDVQAQMLHRALIPLSYEHDSYGDYVGLKTMELAKSRAEVVRLMRRSVERWCDWLDSLVHFKIHASWHLAPVMFDPDSEKRELAVLGVNQRNFAQLGDFGKKWWEWHHGEASVRFQDSPKWQTLGRAMAEDKERIWNHPDVDSAIIRIWPLLKRNNWTYREMRSVVQMVLPKRRRYPLESDQDFSAYCANVLGLSKSGKKGRSKRGAQPRGWEVAVKLCQPDASPGSS